LVEKKTTTIEWTTHVCVIKVITMSNNIYKSILIDLCFSVEWKTVFSPYRL